MSELVGDLCAENLVASALALPEVEVVGPLVSVHHQCVPIAMDREVPRLCVTQAAEPSPEPATLRFLINTSFCGGKRSGLTLWNEKGGATSNS